jgi:4-alpha-glucanotransferase
MAGGVLSARRGGVLCHLTSLPGAAKSGTLGDAALRFLDFMQRAGLSVWQVLPLNPPDEYGSPYHSESLFALNAALIDPALGLNEPDALRRYVRTHRDAHEQFEAGQNYWLDDFCRFSVARALHGADWTAWPPALRKHDADALAAFDRAYAAALEAVRFSQFAISHGFAQLRAEATARNIHLFGDMPLYPAFESADVWSHQEVFLLDTHQRPSCVAGVPPDYFSETGQLWGNPVYDWDRLVETGFSWWIERVRAQLQLFDIARIDHFRGLEAFWAIPPDATSAVAGAWRPAPGNALLSALRDRFGPLPVVAEDLGVITPQVDALRESFDLPGMRVAQFAFSGDARNPHLPSNYVANTAAYTGTHDNDTTLGWYTSLDDSTRAEVDRLTGVTNGMPWALIDVVLGSVANLAVVPLQDFLSLDGAHRMNTPGETDGNWRWRFDSSQLTRKLADRIGSSLAKTGRL